ncbi:conserved unknown protein [Ectocarpus siliculosus]|uniref:WLM domain-containing protein n=1 Tax=Ectocarpus siliculosus TaxID=2880 RepID=D7FR84_ECTSI|nr:conserved unknown protein [Ectocarpus siliculosus]|eukprot:CBJ49209.1 conserved unknown protein [Ectocarpus siliculosus]
MELQVSFRGEPLTVTGVDHATAVENLKNKLEELTAVPVANQKLILKGKALRDEAGTLEAAGVLVPSPAQTATTTTATERHEEKGDTFVQKSKLMLVGSKPSEVEEVLREQDRVRVRNDLNGQVTPKGYKKVALNYPPGPSDLSPYRFERIETLPGLPEEETARKILESLAADPGVRAVLEKHRWTVGALCELYPEGKVGVSDKCVLGLNQNHGMKIFLRLRTDDLRGFRKILSIRKVLFHELAHNDISDHDDNFYMLMRQVEREAAELNWMQQSGGRTVAGRPPAPRAEPAGLPGGGEGFILVKEAFEGGSGRLGGDSNAFTKIFSAGEMAGQAAVQRLTPEEQEVEDCCGHTKGVAAGAAEVEKEERLAETNAMASSVSEMSVTSDDLDDGVAPALTSAAAGATSGDHGGTDGKTRGGEERQAERGQRLTGASEMNVAEEEGDGISVEPVDSPPLEAAAPTPLEMDEEPSPVARASPAPSPTPPPPPETLAAAATKLGPAPRTPESSSLDELLAMGFPREAAVEALSASGGSIPDAAYRLLTPGMMESGRNNSSEAVGMTAAGGGAQGSREAGRDTGSEGAVRLPRDVRLQQAADRVAGHADRARAVQCLDVLAAVLRNIMEHPEEAKFRKVRRSNGKFKASVGAVAGGVDLLLAAGFEERGDDQLELGRQDPGLIWLAKSTVEAWQERLCQV